MIVQLATSEEPEPEIPAADPPTEKNEAAVALARLGAKKGGYARAKKLSKRRRTQQAKKAAKARWGR